MLGKLIKYEFKSTSRVMWILYGALVVIGALLGVMFKIDEESVSERGLFGLLYGRSDTLRVMSGSLALIYMLMIWAIFIMTVIMIIRRFYNNLLGGEGYLMHTLPVKTHNLILSKGIVAIIWGIIALVSGLISAFLLTVTSGLFKMFLEEIESWDMFWETLGSIFTTNTWLMIALVAVSAVSSILCFYFAMAIGNLANKNKFLIAVVAYIGIQIVLSIISSILAVNGSSNIIMTLAFDESGTSSLMVRQIIFNVVLAVVYFFGTDLILKKRLNLA